MRWDTTSSGSCITCVMVKKIKTCVVLVFYPETTYITATAGKASLVSSASGPVLPERVLLVQIHNKPNYFCTF